MCERHAGPSTLFTGFRAARAYNPGMSLLTTLALVLLLPVQDAFYAPPPGDEVRRAGLPVAIERYETDLAALRRYWNVTPSEGRRRAERGLFEAWEALLEGIDFAALDLDGRIDWLLFRNRLTYELRRLDLEAERWSEVAELVPFAGDVAELQEQRRRLERFDARAAAARLHQLSEAVEDLSERVVAQAEAGGEEPGDEAGEAAPAEPGSEGSELPAAPLIANRAAGHVRSLRRALGDWYRYTADYDPLFTWWCEEAFEELDQNLEDYARHLREEVAGVEEDDTDTILGDPIGREQLLAELAREFIPYTPEELIEIAEQQFAWCDRELLRAAAELGFEDDWRAAQEHVKDLHVEPGDQPRMIADLAEEAVAFLEANELLTVPPFAKRVWRMNMMSPERQQQTPYFTGGEVISVSYPTAEMDYEDKLMSMRGNNRHFSRATVHHELIPGHHLQQFMRSRYATHRRLFSTPFWGEGWAVYWELLLWDLDFPQGPEDRVGFLFWRKHRCARIVFSLRFHLGQMTADECIDYLVERVGHERRNATAEVRRSVQGGYGPLYQAAYMTGALQFRALHAELVGSGRMTNRAFHDAILRENSIPIELVRAKLIGQELSPDHAPSWRFDAD